MHGKNPTHTGHSMVYSSVDWSRSYRGAARVRDGWRGCRSL